jgi:hypothetical protein
MHMHMKSVINWNKLFVIHVEPSFVYVAWKHDIVVEKSKSKSPMWSDNFKNWNQAFKIEVMFFVNQKNTWNISYS